MTHVPPISSFFNHPVYIRLCFKYASEFVTEHGAPLKRQMAGKN